MIAVLRDLASDESGTAIVEYALVVSLVSMVSFATLYGLGVMLQDFFASSSDGLQNVGLYAK